MEVLRSHSSDDYRNSDNEVILNDADVTFTSPNPQEPPITETILTNLVVTTINIAFIFPLKLVDKEVATVGEILTYDVLIFNFGTVPATNVQFIDTTSAGVAFVPGSVSINGVPAPGLNPFIGFTVQIYLSMILYLSHIRKWLQAYQKVERLLIL